MLRAINIGNLLCKKFYGSLTDEQKKRFNRLDKKLDAGGICDSPEGRLRLFIDAPRYRFC